MQQTSGKVEDLSPGPSPQKERGESGMREAIMKTLAFFSLYDLPITRDRLYELLGIKADQLEFEYHVNFLLNNNKMVQKGSLVALKAWSEEQYLKNQQEITKRKEKVERYFKFLSLIPFVKQISLINSLAIGNADSESDIDFFVITKPRRLYFVRSIIIVLFRMLGVYKTRQKVADQFCFGFYVTTNHLKLEHLLIKPSDPYFVFWLACTQPLLGRKTYLEFMQANNWIYDYLPNFEPNKRLASIHQSNWFIRALKLFLEIILWLPAEILEPVAKFIHIRHTFKLPENLSKTSTTVANKDILKLHAEDARREVAARYEVVLTKALSSL